MLISYLSFVRCAANTQYFVCVRAIDTAGRASADCVESNPPVLMVEPKDTAHVDAAATPWVVLLIVDQGAPRFAQLPERLLAF